MAHYTVTFTVYHTYDVEADDEFAAEKEALEEFEHDMCSPIADTHYDDIEIEEDEEDEEDEKE